MKVQLEQVPLEAFTRKSPPWVNLIVALGTLG